MKMHVKKLIRIIILPTIILSGNANAQQAATTAPKVSCETVKKKISAANVAAIAILNSANAQQSNLNNAPQTQGKIIRKPRRFYRAKKSDVVLLNISADKISNDRLISSNIISSNINGVDIASVNIPNNDTAQDNIANNNDATNDVTTNKVAANNVTTNNHVATNNRGNRFHRSGFYVGLEGVKTRAQHE